MNLNGRQVLARMRRGDLPTLKGGYTARSVFADGAVASHKVMHRLQKLGKINLPAKSSIYSPWTLARESEDG